MRLIPLVLNRESLARWSANHDVYLCAVQDGVPFGAANVEFLNTSVMDIGPAVIQLQSLGRDLVLFYSSQDAESDLTEAFC